MLVQDRQRKAIQKFFEHYYYTTDPQILQYPKCIIDAAAAIIASDPKQVSNFLYGGSSWKIIRKTKTSSAAFHSADIIW